MSFRNVVAFDVLTDQDDPFDGFGPVLQRDARYERVFLEQVELAKGRVSETFHVDLTEPDIAPKVLDTIVREMWNQSWNPETGNLDLFVTDFGLVVFSSVADLEDGVPTFRSHTDPLHTSIHWASAAVEAFPFHKALKMLIEGEGESAAQFVRGVSKLVRDLQT